MIIAILVVLFVSGIIAIGLFMLVTVVKSMVGIAKWNKRRLDHFKKLEADRKYYALPRILGGDGN